MRLGSELAGLNETGGEPSPLRFQSALLPLLGLSLWLLLCAIPIRAQPPAADHEAAPSRLLPVPHPDLSRLEADVRHALEQARSELDRQSDGNDARQGVRIRGANEFPVSE